MLAISDYVLVVPESQGNERVCQLSDDEESVEWSGTEPRCEWSQSVF